MKWLLVLGLFLLFPLLGLQAQITQYYSFSATTETYQPLPIAHFPEEEPLYGISEPHNLPFPFYYCGNTYTQVCLTSNGYITLGTATNCTGTNNLASTQYCPVLAPLWDDLALGFPMDEFSWGTAPNRVYAVGYNDVRPHFQSNVYCHFQIKLYENGNIQFCYGPSSGTLNLSASIGINAPPGGTRYFTSITPGTNPIVSNTVVNNNVTTYPGDGVVFNFSLPPNDLAAISLTGSSQLHILQPADFTLTLANQGSCLQSDYTVKLFDQTDNELLSLAGTPIAQQDIISITLSWIPLLSNATSVHARICSPLDPNPANDNSPLLNINVDTGGMTASMVGTGDEYATVPVDMAYGRNFSETLYLDDELDFTGLIHGLVFYNNFDVSVQDTTLIWLGTTDVADLSAAWIPSSALTPVFDGRVSFPAGQHEIIIPLSTPFYYDGGNLVMMMWCKDGQMHMYPQMSFKAQTSPVIRNRIVGSLQGNIDPNFPSDTWFLAQYQYPQTMFMVREGTFGFLDGTVLGMDNQPLPGAVVQIDALGQTLDTNQQGRYNLTLPTGTYTLICTATGYQSQSQEVTITSGDSTTLDFHLPLTAATDPLYQPVSRLTAYPNPFAAQTSIGYTVKKPGLVNVSVYNLKGQLVRTLTHRYYPAGNFTQSWDGADNSNHFVGNGLYFCRMKAGNEVLTQRILLLKN